MDGVFWTRGSIQRWDVATWKSLPDLPRDDWTQRTSLDGRTDIRVKSELVEVIDRATGNPRRKLPGPSQAVGNLAFSADGRWLAAESLSDSRVWDLLSGKEQYSFSARHCNIASYTHQNRHRP
jgi:WD40 repeat protein